MVEHMYIFTFMVLECTCAEKYRLKWFIGETLRPPCAVFCAHVLHFTLTDNILNVILAHSEILPGRGTPGNSWWVCATRFPKS